jgi:hypothetical protein
MGISAFVGFNLGIRWTEGKREEEVERREVDRERRGRRGTVKLSTLRIRR